MRYVISDIHGESSLLKELLEAISFSSSDVLYVCGDMIEKGDDSLGVIRMLKGKSNVRCIKGNHEHDFVKYYLSLSQDDEVDYDAVLKKMKEYIRDDSLTYEEIDWVLSLPYFIEDGDDVFVHAGIRTNERGEVDPKGTADEEFVYSRTFKDPVLLPASKTVYFGHTPTQYLYGEPRIVVYKNHLGEISKVHLDLGSYLSGVLGCYRIDDGKAFYVQRSTKKGT